MTREDNGTTASMDTAKPTLDNPAPPAAPFQRHPVPRGYTDEMCIGLWKRAEMETMLNLPGTCVGIHVITSTSSSLLSTAAPPSAPLPLPSSPAAAATGHHGSDHDDDHNHDHDDDDSDDSDDDDDDDGQDDLSSIMQRRGFATTVGVRVVLLTSPDSLMEEKDFSVAPTGSAPGSHQQLSPMQQPVWSESVFGVWRQYSHWRNAGLSGSGLGLQCIVTDGGEQQHPSPTGDYWMRYVHHYASQLQGLRLTVENGAWKARGAQLAANRAAMSRRAPPSVRRPQGDEMRDSPQPDAHPSVPSVWSALAAVKVHVSLRNDSVWSESDDHDGQSAHARPASEQQQPLPSKGIFLRLLSSLVRPIVDPESRELLAKSLRQTGEGIGVWHGKAVEWGAKALHQQAEDVPKVAERVLSLADWAVVGAKLSQQMQRMVERALGGPSGSSGGDGE